MNHVYRLKRSGRTQQLQPVPETARSAGKGQARTGKTLAQTVTATVASVALAGVASLAHAQQAPPASAPAATQLPQGGVVTRGSANIVTSTGANTAQLTVNQASNRAVIDWASFNVGSNAKVQFNQPGTNAVTLNNILGNNASQIYGQISANGQVFLSNPNGVYFSPTAQVDVGGLVATTGKANADDFMAGKTVFNREGSTGSILNEGQLKAAAGGYIALLAPEVRNQGVVIAQAGTVALASGEAITLSFNNSGTGLAGLTTTPQAIAALVNNQSAVLAEGGQIILSAHALATLQGAVVKNSGQLSATSLMDKGGKIVLMADKVELTGTGKIDANGATGGGTVLVGSDWQGSGDTRQATQVSMAQGASIEANATQNGDGGKVVLWSDVGNASSLTQVDGRIEAKGAGSGNGGQVETSGHTLQIGDQATVNTQATGTGQSGQWLLDPADITISSSADAGYTNTGGSMAPNSGVNTSTINVTTLQTALASGDVTISTTNTGTAGTGTGNITVSAATLSWSSGSKLTLQAAGTITAGNTITTGTSASNLTLDIGADSTITGTIAGSGSLTKLGAGKLSLTHANSYSGGTTISAGTLVYGTTGSLGTGTVVNNTDITVNGAAVYTLANNLSGTGTMTLVGNGLVLTGDNSGYSGAITMTDSGVAGGSSLKIGSGSTTGTLGTGSVSIGSGTSLIFSRSNALTVSALLSGAGTVVQQGTGTTTLSNNSNSYTGGTKLAGGTLSLGNPDVLGPSGTITFATGTLQWSVNNTTDYSSRFSTAGNYSLDTNGQNVTLASSLSSSGTLTKLGSGTLTLTGANTYAGITTISAGTLAAGSATAFSTGTIYGTGTLDLNGQTLANAVSLGSGGNNTGVAGTIVNSSASAATLTGQVTVGGVSTSTTGPLNIVADHGIITLGNTYSLTLAANLTLGGSTGGVVNQPTGNNAGNQIIKQGTGTWTLNALNNHPGGVTISQGVLKLGNVSALGAGGAVSVASGAALDLNGKVVSGAGALTLIGTGVNGGGALMNSSTTAASYNAALTLAGDTTISGDTGAITWGGTLTGANHALTLGGAVGGTAGGTITNTTSALTKADAGTWKLTGTNTYNGLTTISGGTLQIGTGSSTGALPSSFSVASGATLAYNVTTASALTSTATFTGAGTILNQAYGTSLNLSGATLTGFNGTYAVSVNEVPVTPTMASMVLPANPNLSNNSLSVTTAGFQPGFLPLQVITWSGSNSGTAPALLLNGASVSSGVTNLGGTVTLFTNNLTLGTGALWTLTIGSAAPTYYTTAIDTSGANLTANATANLAPGATVTQSGAITGTGNLTVIGSGTLTLSGANTYSGTTTVNSGITLKTGSATALGTGAVTVASGGALDLAGQTLTSTGTLTLNGTGISNSGALFNSSSTGATYAGPLALGSASTINGGSGSITLSNTGSITGAGFGLTLGGASGGTLAGGLNTGTGTLTKQDAGTWTLTGNSTATGGITVNAGTLQIGNGGANGAPQGGGGALISVPPLASSSVSVASGATLAYNLAAGSTPTFSYSGGGTLLNLKYGSSLNLSGATPSGFTGTYAVSVDETVATPTVASIVLRDSLDLSGITFSVRTTGYQQSFTSLPVITWGGTSSNSPTLKINGLSTTSGTNAVGGSLYLNANNLSLGQGAMWSFTNSGSTTYYATDSDNTNTTLSTATITVPPGVTATESGLLSGASSLTVNGGGTLVLSGANNYSGGTTVSSATTLQAGSATAMGTGAATVASGGALDLAGKTMTSTGNLTLNGSGVNGGGALMNSSTTTAGTYAGLVLLGSSSSIISGGGSGSITLSKTGTITGTGFALTLGGAAGGTLTSTIGTSTGGTLVKQDAGTWTLNASNSYTGGTTVNGGVLKAGNASAFGGSSGGTVTVASGAAVDFNGLTILTNMTINGTGVAGGGALFNSNVTTAATLGNGTAGTTALTLGSDSSVVGGGALFYLNANTIAGGAYGLTLGGTTGGSFYSAAAALNNSIASLNKVGAGTWILNTANTLSGPTTVSAGKLEVGNANAFGTGAVTVASGATIDLKGTAVVNAGVLTLNGSGISNGGALTNSSGTAASYSGLLQLGSDSLINASSGSITLGNTGSITGNGFKLTLGGSGSIAGSIDTGSTGSVTKQSTGTWTLSGASTYGGGTTVSVGTLKAGSATAFGTGDIGTSSSGVIDINGQTMTSTGMLTLNASTAAASFLNSSATPATYAGRITLLTAGTNAIDGGTGGLTISNAGTLVGNAKTLQLQGNGTLMSQLDTSLASLTRSGAGTWTVSGNNTYIGGTSATSGTLRAGSAAAFGTGSVLAANGGAVDLNGQNLTTATLYLQGTGVSSSGAVFNSSTTGATYAGPVVLQAASSIVGGAGIITLNSATAITGATFGLTLGGAAGGNISSNITTTTGTLTKTDSGTWTLSGANSYTGGTSINGGTLAMGSANALNTTGTISFGGGTLRLFNTTDYSPRFSTAASQAYSLDTNGQNVTLATNLTSSGGTFTKLGSGTLTLTGTNTYTGATSVLGGTLSIAADSALGTAPGSATPSSLTLDGGTLAVTANMTLATNRGITLGAGNGTVDVASGMTLTYGGVAAGASLTKTGSGTLLLSGANTYTGSTTVSAGTLAVSNAAGLGTTAGGTTVASGAILDLQNAAVGAEALTLNGGTLKTSTGTSSLAGDVTLGANATVDVGGTQLTLSGAVSGAYDLSKSGAGTLVLSGANNVYNGTNINAGTLQANSATALGSGTVAVASGAMLAYNGAATVAPSNIFTGAGTIANVGYGHTLDLSGTSLSGFTGTYQAAVDESVSPNRVASIVLPSGLNLSSNTLSVNTVGLDSNFVATPVITWTSVSGTAPTLKLNGTTVSGIQSVNGRYLDLTAGSLILKPVQTLWTLTINGVVTSYNTTSDSLGAILAYDGTINIPAGLSVTESGVLSGTGKLTITGGGSILLSGTNTYGGGTVINAGTLQINSDSNLGAVPGLPTTNITINGATLAVSGQSSAVTLPSTRKISIGASGGTISNASSTWGLSINGAISASGPVTISGGDLNINGNVTVSNASPILIKSTSNIIQAAGTTVSTAGGNITYWSDSDGSGDGYIWLNPTSGATPGAKVNSYNGNIVLGGGSAGVGAPTGAARGPIGVYLQYGTSVQAGSGDVSIQGVGNGLLSGAGYYGVSVLGAVSGTNVTITGTGYDNTSTTSGGVNLDGATITGSGLVNITATGGGTLNTASSLSSNTGLTMRNSTVQATGSGSLLVNATGGGHGAGVSNLGLYMRAGTGDASFLTDSGSMTLNLTGGGAGGSSNAGLQTVLSSSTDTSNIKFASQTGNITLRAQDWSFASSTASTPRYNLIQTAGALTIEPLTASTSYGTGGLDLSYVSLSNTLSSLTLGKAGNTARVGVGSTDNLAYQPVSSYSVAGPITLYGDVYIGKPLTTTGTGSSGLVTLSGNVRESLTGSVTAPSLLLAGTGSSLISMNSLATNGNRVGTLAGSGLGSVAFSNASATGTPADGTLTVGSVNGVNGLSATGTVNVSTYQGDLVLNETITTTSAATSLSSVTPAILLNAGKYMAVGDSSSGNIVLNGSSAINMGAGGQALLYSGSVSGSTGLVPLVGSGSGHFRYGSTNTGTGGAVVGFASSGVNNYTTALGTSGYYAIYRERPTVTWSTTAAQNLSYGATPVAAVSGSATGLVNGDVLDASMTFRLASDRSLAALNTRGFYDAGNYYYSRTEAARGLGYQVSNPTVTINRINLSVTAKDATKVYDGHAYTGGNGWTVSGFIGSDTQYNSLSGTATYSGSSQGAINASPSGSPYAITPGGLTLSSQASKNYNLVYNSGALTVTKAPLTVYVNNDARLPGEADHIVANPTVTTTSYAGASYVGLKNGQSESVLGGALNIVRLGVDEIPGFYKGVLVGSGLTSPNYTITYKPGDYTILPADQLLVRVTNIASTYASTPVYAVSSAKYFKSSTNSVVDLTSRVVLNGAALTLDDGAGGNTAFTLGALSTSLSSSGNINVGAYQLGATSITNTSSNYNNTITVTGALQVNPLAVSAAVTSSLSKSYDGQLTLNGLTLGLTGTVAGDLVSASGYGVYASKDAGAGLGYTVSNIALSGQDARNYTIVDSVSRAASNTLSGSNGVINAVPLQVSANNDSKVYDGNAYSGGNGLTYTGFVNLEDASVLGGALVYGGSSQGATNAGTYGIVPSGLSSINYTIAYTNGSLVINPAGLTAVTGTVIAPAGSAITKVYDGNNTATLAPANYSIVGWAAGDGATVTKTTGTYDSADAGTGKTVTVSLLPSDYAPTGSTVLSNYSLPTSVSGAVGVITAKLVTVTNTARTTTYDGVTTYGTLASGMSFTTSAMVGGDKVGAVTQTAQNVSASGVAQAAPFAVRPSNGVMDVGNPANYDFSYVDATHTVAKADLAVTALSLTATPGSSGNVYNNTAYTGTYTTNALGNDASSITVTGMASGTNAGTYTSSLQVSGAVLSNYNTPVITEANLVVSPKPVTITNTSRTTTYDGTSTYGALASGTAFTTSALVGSDSVASVTQTASGTGVTSAGVAQAGSFSVTPGSALLGTGTASNYSFSYVNSTHTVNPVVVTPEPVSLTSIGGVLQGLVSKVYDGSSTATLTSANYTLTGWLGSDGATVTKTTGTYDNANAGSGKMVTVSVTNADYMATGSTNLGNYTLPSTISGAVGTITAKPVTVTNTARSTTYDGTSTYGALASGTAFTTSALVGFDRVASVTQTASGTGVAGSSIAQAGSFTVTPSSAVLSTGTASNYSFTYVPVTMTVSPAVVSASIVGSGSQGSVSKVYDGSNVATLSPANYALSGWLGTDGATVTKTSGTYDNANEGSGKTVTVSVTHADYMTTGATHLSNYALPSSISGAVGEITAKPVTENKTSSPIPKPVVLSPALTSSVAPYQVTVLKLPQASQAGVVHIALSDSLSDVQIALPDELQQWIKSAATGLTLEGDADQGMTLDSTGAALNVASLTERRWPLNVVLRAGQESLAIRMVKAK